MTVKRTPLEERFWIKVDVAGADDCWEWTACKKRGYGSIGQGGRRGAMLVAHRVSWELHNGEIPDGLCVCHKCDNRGCVNPAHLFLGTKADNSQDMAAKGRGVNPILSGEKNGNSKLTAPDVVEIRRQYAADDVYQRQLAKEFGVSRALIGCIVRGENWAHVGEQYGDWRGHLRAWWQTVTGQGWLQ